MSNIVNYSNISLKYYFTHPKKLTQVRLEGLYLFIFKI